ncbi:TALPID3 protein-like isoform X2 [Anneissia japonica]|uniref:TALPID3 protein-like isoform X2 n=1 Tax=Anneissia japonica TaxID=1529436 RepID=UPI001425921C|nr:TALPID3 protein-like isoform X2 [Anneissia japonica]
MKDVQPMLSNQAPKSLARGLKQRSGATAARTEKKKARAKIDTGLRKVGSKDVVETKHKKKTSAKEKENRPLEKKPTSKPAKTSTYEDEDYLTRVYGKAIHSPKRRTMKTGPYLRYNYSPPRPKSMRRPAVQLIQGPKVKSTKTQTQPERAPERAPELEPAEHQFYFNPNVHPSINQPSSSGQEIEAPTQGQLIPMAIPLREPRTGGAVLPLLIRRRRVDDDEDSDDSDDTIEGAAHSSDTNVFTEIESQLKPKQHLKIQSMPNIDIQPTKQPPKNIEIIEENQEELEEDKLEDAAVPGYDKSPQFQDYVAVADGQMEDDTIDELPEPGIAITGQPHHESQYHGPAFPPQPPPPLTEDLPSNAIASDIRRKELLQNQAVQWIEQELMARMVSDMYQRQEDMRAHELEERCDDREDSVSEVSSQDAFVDRVGGPAGLQLFVDAGQPVDQGLVENLIREAIAERIAATLSQQEKERSPMREVIQVNTESDTEQEYVKGPIKTPEVTPVTTPAGSPPVKRSLPSTPAETPTSSESESVQELMVSMPREISATDDDLAATIAGPASPVRTPVQTPPPSPPSRPLTPDASPPPPVSPAAELQSTASLEKSPSPEPWTQESPVAEEALLDQTGEASPAQGAVAPDLENEPDSLAHVTPLPLTPSPLKALPDTPVYQSPESSESSESTHDFTSTETTDRPISEGEWLNGRSEGEIIPRVVRNGVYVSSSDDTVLQTEEMEDLTMDEPPSEGEVLPKKVHFHGDPVLAILARINQHPPGRRSQANQSMIDSELSLGEVGIRQRLHPSIANDGLPSAGHLNLGRHHQQSDSEMEAGEVVRRKSSMNGRTSPGEVILTRREPQIEDFTLRMSELRVPNPHSREPSAEAQVDEDPKPPDKLPSKIPVAKPRVIQVASKSWSPRSPEAPVGKGVGKHSASKEDQPNEEAPPQAEVGGTQTLQDFDTRTLTPDVLNMDAYLQSGYLTQTFSQSEPATSDFEQTGTSVAQNRTGFGLSQTLSNNGGATLNMSLDSLEMSQDKLQNGKGTRKFMVTLPTAHELEASLSQSDVEIEKDEDEISDVSEIF